ncbi:MAG TPA: cytochrome P450 [Actinomycetota bacterium]|nr:cytochrome P450 [Actinomycetota bacterium]
MSTATGVRQPPRVSGGETQNGHLEELRTDPIGLMRRVREECGPVGEFVLGDRRVALLSGAEASEPFFRASEEELNQAEAYPFMTPIFGKGVVFDAPPERRAEMLHNQSLKDRYMRGHAQKIATEVEDMVGRWDAAGEIDLLDFFAELTIYTSSSCLIGKKFRDQLDRRFADLYHDLERGTDALAYVDAYADIESFRRRDTARAGLVQLVEAIMAARRQGTPPTDEDRDLLDVLISVPGEGEKPRFTADEITGIFISMMFAGHHTTSGTAAWTLIELLKHPDEMKAVVAELDDLYADNPEVSYQALREMPRLESAIKEALRLHPPLILLLRVAKQPMDVGGFRIDEGNLVAVSPAVSNRIPEDFPNADAFVPERYLDPRREDLANPWTWIPFGAGKHRCVGAAFAVMQLKAIFSVLFRGWEFELAQPHDTYRNDHSKMVVQLEQPCRAGYRERSA